MQEGFAITGMACVFPGAASLSAYWERIVRAEPAPQVSLSARWGIPAARILGPVGAPHRTYLDRAFVLPWSDVPSLDPDPQVSVGKHVVAEALASVAAAGTPLDRSATALVVGTSWTAPSFFDSDAALARGARRDDAPPYTPERQLAMLAGDLGGPRCAVDTACASSLYAIDVAIRLLTTGQARAAVVLGLNALLTPFLYVGFAKLRALSPAGTLLPFAADASGIVPGEGAGALVIEPLSAALGAGRRVRAVVRGVGLSSDGAERSVFAPGERGERLAYERAHAGLDPADVDYIEAHGTATPVGDETEIATLDAFFGASRSAPLPVGSVKSLVGHTLSAAGMASVIKCALMLEADRVPPHVHVTPHPRLATTRLALPAAPAPLARRGDRARIGISAFGFGGSNAHVVLDRAPTKATTITVADHVRRPADLAVLDLRVEVGSLRGVRALRACLAGEAPLASRTLPDEIEIEARGLRMGPNLLRRLDPLQLLLAATARDALAGLTSLDPERTGVVMVSNLGGDTALRLSRRDLFAPDAPELTVETIASSLPSMASGYPAYHLDLRGFHETVAGDASTFGALLATAPSWLDEACDVLVLGVGRLLKSPLEWPAHEPAGEAYGVLVVTRAELARARGWPVRGLLAPSRNQTAPHAMDDAVRAKLGVLLEAEPFVRLAAAIGGDAPEAEVDIGSRLHWTRGAPFDDARPAPPSLPLVVKLERPLPPSRASAAAEREGRAPAVDVAGLLAAISSSEAAAREVLASHRAAIGLIADRAPTADPPEASVLTRVSLGAERASAEIVVDESDPYFFDHPLDHVPGILLLAAIEELARAVAGDVWLSTMTLQFRRFCEKDRPVAIALEVRGSGAVGAVTQSGAELARFEVGWRAVPAPVPGPRRRDDGPRAAPATVHKLRSENVLVGPLERRGDAYVCKMHVPPAGHFLVRSSARVASALRLLEGGRQVVMCGAHDVLGIPTGLPMNLLKVTLALDAPVPVDATLEGKLVVGQKVALGDVTLGDVTVELSDDATEYGRLSVKAQVVDAATYAAQRGTS